MKTVWIRLGVALAVLALVAGCSPNADLVQPGPHDSPLVIAHRGGSGQWPQNSRTAVLNSIATARVEDPARRYQGIEIDIALTRDGHPVLSHDPWVHTTLCRTVSGEPVGERILIREKTLAELQSQYLCGGVADKDFPEVIPKAEAIMTLEEVLAALKDAPAMVLYLDIKIDGDLTADAEAYAAALAERLAAAQLPNRLYIEGPSAESLRAYRAAIHTDFAAVLSYPPFSAGKNAVLTAAVARWLTKLRLRNPLSKARAADADAVAAPKQVITRHAAEQARGAGVAVILFAPNTREDLDKYCAWPADGLITDFPQLGPCP